ncbi:MAG: T9SS type A sorting domain-containing protein [Flavobacterium sp.]
MKTILSIFISLFSLFLNGQCFQSVSTHYQHSLALKTDGSLWSWGSNDAGELGSGSTLNSYTPQRIGNATDWSEIFAQSSASFVIKNNGTLWACGDGTGGRLGTGIQGNAYVLTQVGTDNNWDFVTAGAGTIALKTNGTLWGWGSNVFGQLNLGAASVQLTPIQISSETDWMKVVAGSNFTLAIKTNGTLWACGLNDKRQLGDGTNTNRFNFVQIGTDNNWLYLATGFLFKHSFAIKTDGTLWGWGSNLNNVQGLPSTVPYITTPTQIGTANNWSKVATGYYSTIAIRTDGTLWMSSATGFYQIGTDTDWNWIDSGEAHFFAMKTDGTLWGQGGNDYGQLGLGSSIQGTTIPTQLNCSAFLNIEEVNTSSKIVIYPNPTNEILIIENSSNSTIDKITLTDITGKIILEENNNFSKMNMENFETGIYILKISSDNRIYNYKIAKK